MILFAAASLIFVACSGEKKATDAPADDATQTETPAPAAETASGDALEKYEALVNKAIPILQKIQKGDMSAANDYQKLNKEISDLMPQLQAEAANMTPEKAAKYQELAQKLLDAATPKK